jgi:hypothetical protein
MQIRSAGGAEILTRSIEHCLQPGGLRAWFDDLAVV